MGETRVQDEQGNVHVFPAEATPEMIAQALNVKPPRPDFAQNPPAMPAPPNAILQDQAKAQSAVQAAGPYTQPGAAEAGMGFGRTVGDILKTSGQSVAQAANVAAPVLTGGASLPAQMAIQGATSGAQTATEGGTPGQIAGSAAIGAAIPAVAHGASAVAGKVIKGLLVPAATKAAATAVPEASTVAQAAKTTTQINQEVNQVVAPKVSRALHTALDTAAKDAGVPASTEASASAKAQDVSNGVKKQAQRIYQQLDSLSGGRYQRFRDQIDDLQELIRNKAHIDPEGFQVAKEKLAEAEQNYKAVQEILIKDRGVDPEFIKQADAKWTQGKALEDVAKKFRNAETLSGDLKPGTSSLDGGLKNLRPGRLDAALGKQAAAQVRQDVIDAGRDIVNQRAAGAQARQAARQSVEATKTAAAKAQQEIQAVSTRRKIALGLAGSAAGIGAALATAGKAKQLVEK